MRTEARRVLPPGDATAVWRDFRWRVPEDFAIHRACCDDWAGDDPDRVAIIDIAESGARRDITYGDLKDRSDRLASAFAAWGVGKGDRVAVLLSQCAEVMVAHVAAMKLGAVVLPLFTLFGPDALRFRLADSGAKVVVTDDAGLEKLADLRDDLPDLREVVTIGTGAGRRLGELLAAFPPLAGGAEVGPEDPAMLIYTSGTTGPPKGALQAHRFLIGHLPVVEMSLERFPKAGDVGWTPADWAWIGGLMDLAMPCLYFGVPLVAHRMRKFTPEATWALLAATGANVLFLPPTALKLLRRSEVPEGIAVRAICSGGESLPPDLVGWAKAALGAEVNELYGQTECNLVVCSGAGMGVAREGAIGRPAPGHDVRIIGADGEEMPRGEVGEIAVRRPDPVMFLGYWGQPAKTAAKFIGDWLKTGDLGRMDAEGYVSFVSRDDDVITSAGYRIGPSEIENCLTGDPDVVMAAAVGVPDAERTEVVKAFVVLREGASREGLEARLIRLVRERVSPHVAPRSVEVVESLPMTATGKIMRRALREPG